MRVTVMAGMICSFVLCGCAARVRVTPVVEQPTLNGIPYALPKTVVGTTITVQRVEDTPGPYRGYAACFFPDLDLINDITYKPEVQYSIKSGSLSTKGIPDAAHVYIIDATAGWLHKKTLNAQLTEDGLLTKSDIETKNEAISFTMSTAKSLATIAGNVLSVSAANTLNMNAEFATGTSYDELLAPLRTCSAKLGKFNDIDDEKAKEAIKKAKDAVDTLINKINEFQDDENKRLAASNKPQPGGSKAPKAQNPPPQSKAEGGNSNLEEAKRDYDTSDFAAAAAAFKKLSDLQNSRLSAVSNLPQGSLTAESLKEILDEYNSQENIYLALFAGKETVDTWIPYFEPTPPDEPLVEDGHRKKTQGAYPEYPVDLFRYQPDNSSSLSAGICLDPKFASISIPKKFRSKDCKDLSNQSRKVQIILSTGFDDKPEMAALFQKAKADGDRSYYFRIPAHAIASVVDVDAKEKDKSEVVVQSTVLVAQWGVIASLPVDMGGSRTKYSVELAPTTGALMNFAAESDSKMSGTDLSGLETGSKAIADQLAARPNELKKLQNEEQRLEQRCKINAIKKVKDPTLDCSSVSKQQ